MTVPSETSSVRYTADGIVTAFTITFPFQEASHIRVFVDNILTTTGFTVTGGSPTGTLTFDSAPADEAEVFIRRVVPILQDKAYPTNDTFPSATHEAALDKLTYIGQQLQRDVAVALTYPESLNITAGTLPAPVDDAILAFHGTTGAMKAGPTITAFVSATATVEAAVTTTTEQAGIATTKANEANASAIAAAASAASINLPDIEVGDAGKILQVNVGEDGYDLEVLATGADDISYDNTESGLVATDVQAAIDEVAGISDVFVDQFEVDITTSLGSTGDMSTVAGIHAVSTTGSGSSVTRAQGTTILSTGTTTTGDATFFKDGSAINFDTKKVVSARVLLSTASDGTNTFTARFGLCNSGNFTTFGAGFRYSSTENGGNWVAFCTMSSVSSVVNTIIAPSFGSYASNTGQILSVELTAADCKFYINGVLVATITTNVPTLVVARAPGIQIVKSAGTTSRDIRFVWMKYVGTKDYT